MHVFGEIFLLAIGSMFWPLLLVVDVIAFRTSRPVPILASFVCGGLITTVAIGCVIVFSLEDTTLVTDHRRTTDASVDIAIGILAVVAALVIRRHGGARTAEPAKPHDPSRVERLVARGGPLAFVAGIVANVFPGLLPFIALKDIAELDVSTAATVLTIVGFYLVMFIPVEAPVVGFVLAPARTTAAVSTFNAWLSRNLRTIAWSALLIFGVLDIARGVAAAVA